MYQTQGQDVREMLAGIGLEQYADTLINEHGFERIEWLCEANDLNQRCGVKLGHAHAIHSEVQKTRARQAESTEAGEKDGEHEGAG